MKDHRDLEVWNCAVDLAAEVYKITNAFPRTEAFGLCAQMRRAAISVASNLAEGAARRTTRDFIQFVHVARGSLVELQTQIAICDRVGLHVASEALNLRITQVAQLMNGLLRALRKKAANGTQRI